MLDLLGRATKLIAPSSTLVTSLNQERFKDASQFVDQTLNSLFQESITERVPNQFSAAALNGGPLISIDVSFPIKGDITAKSPKPEDKPVLIGRWIVYAEQPMLSVFSALPMPAGGVSGASAAGGCETLRTDLQEACRAFRYVSPAAILNYTVGADTNLAQTLASDAGITAARDKLVQIPPREEQQIKDAAGNLCALIATKVQQIGFSRFDTSAVLWAYGTQAFVGGTAAREMRNAATCPALEAGYAVGLKDRTY